MKKSPDQASLILSSSSGEECLARLRELLDLLESRENAAQNIGTLHELISSLGEEPRGNSGLFLHRVRVPGLSDPISLILHTAVFSPEYWGQTFAEGLLKDPEIFHGKKIVELGTGSGWISLLLLHKTFAREILGLDINPIAVMLASLNKWANGTTNDGTHLHSRFGIPIVDSLRIEVSDLLGAPLSRGETFDHVVGCIPQVLHPDPESLEERKHNLSYQDLYDLSNYCFNQGILEDRFGLPLIARALEEAQLCLNSQGMVTLILGGRPGKVAIEEMFRRRGYEPWLWWTRRIQQADDTDLVSLVKLEQAHDIRFHFFAGQNSRFSISADTATALLKKGKRIYHDLLVYQAKTKFEKPSFGFVRNLHRLGLDSLRKELDFSRISEEQVSFLERLALDLEKSKTIPYPHERGDLRFRRKLSEFLKVYCFYPTEAESLFVGPERQQFLDMVLRITTNDGDLVLVSESVALAYGSCFKGKKLEIVTGNDDLTELLELHALFKPKLTVISPCELNDPTPFVVEKLISHARENPQSWFLIDDSANFDISSELGKNLLLKLVSQHSLPSNLLFLYGLTKNSVFPDFELSFIVNTPEPWLERLDVAAELSYSRINYVVQLYYEWLFEELLAFPFSEKTVSEDCSGQKKLPATNGTPGLASTSDFQEIERDAVFQAKPIDPETDGVIRLDYGEFETSVPDSLVKGLIKGFLEAPADGLDQVVRSRISAYLKRTRHASVSSSQIVLGQGVFPLFGALIQALRDKLGRAPRIAIPRGTYGPIFPCLKYYGAQAIIIETQAETGFLLQANQWKSFLETCSEKPDLLWLTQPSNPSGIYLESGEIRQLLQVSAKHKIYVFADEIFFLLSDLSMGTWTPAELSFAYDNHGERNWLFIADGLAKSFAAGGLRGGFLSCPSETWAKSVQSYAHLPQQVSLRAWDAVYSAFLEEAPYQLIDIEKEFSAIQTYLTDKRRLLSEHRKALLSLLTKFGRQDNLGYSRRGGLFLLGKLKDAQPSLAKETSVLVNPEQWARTPGWCRFCFSIPGPKFNESLLRLEPFLAKIPQEFHET